MFLGPRGPRGVSRHFGPQGPTIRPQKVYSRSPGPTARLSAHLDDFLMLLNQDQDQQADFSKKFCSLPWSSDAPGELRFLVILIPGYTADSHPKEEFEGGFEKNHSWKVF